MTVKKLSLGIFSGKRPHKSLDYLTPMEYIENALMKDRSMTKVLPMYSASTIQIMDQMGKYIHSFRTGQTLLLNVSISSNDEILLYLPKKNEECKWAISLYNLQGNLKKELYTIPCYETTSSTITSKGKTDSITNKCSEEDLKYFVDDKDNIFISYVRVPLFLKLSNNGKLLMAASYDAPFKTPTVNLVPKSDVPQISGERSHSISSNIKVDRQGRVFITVKNRLAQKKDKVWIVSSPSSPIKRIRKEFPEDTDMHRLLIFNSNGKIIAAKKLYVFCDEIYLHNDRLFIIDSLRGMKIYEYKFEI